MKRIGVVICILSILGILVVSGSIYFNISEDKIKTQEMPLEKILEEMPTIKISSTEVILMKKLKEDADVKEVIKGEKSIDLSLAQADTYGKGILPSNIQICEFSVLGNAVCLGYFLDGNRVILIIYHDNQISKSIGVYSNDGEAKAVYENFNNTIFRKTIF